MVEFCTECGAYISPKQGGCSHCKHLQVKEFQPLNLPIAKLTIEDALNYFPSPTMRKYQKEIITQTVQAYQSGKKCVIVIAPTGFGKSLVNAAFTSVIKSFYVTPQLALIDQLLADPNLRGRFVEIKGRQNYQCYYSPRRGVHVGKCVTEGYPCNERLDVCPYWMQKHLALQAPSVLMSLAYLIFEGTTEGSETYLGTRPLLVLDEAHNLEEQCLNHVSLKFTPFSVPYEIYHELLPNLKKVANRVDLDVFLADVAGYLKLILGRLETKSEQSAISLIEAENKQLMERFLENYNLFMFSNSEWVWEIRNDQLLLQPVFAREFMKNLVWKRGENYLISSATILDPEEYLKLNGLTDLLKEDEIEILEAPSTFPPENRPIIDATVGPLTMQQWDNNMPMAVAAVEEILQKEQGNVAVHCYDRKTRVLTQEGFKHFHELSRSDKIATLNPKNGYLEYHRPKRIINYEYRGDMYRIKSRNVDLMVTPDHNLWVAPIHGRKQLRKYRFCTPSQLFTISRKRSYKRHYFAVKRTARWKGEAPKKFIRVEGRRIRLKDWLQFLGWYVAEGSCSKAGRKRNYGVVYVSQSSNSPHLRELESVVSGLGFKYGKYFHKRDNVINFAIYNNSLENLLRPLGDSAPNKRLPQYVKQLPPKMLRLLFETALKGDGTLRFSKGGHPQWQFTTTSDRLSFDLFEIGLKLGMVVSEYSFARSSYKPSAIGGRIIHGRHRLHVLTFGSIKQCAMICTGGRKHAVPRKVRYNGTVGCVDIQNHIIFVERNGNGCWCGNCHSYRHQRALTANLSPKVKNRLIVHTGENREEKLQEWMRSRGKVFVSVAFNEGQDWKYDVCEAQILLKVPFADIGDRRVKRRLELGNRQWYLNQAMLEVIQAYGRAVRAEDDTARFYVVDGSCTELIRNTWQFIPDWVKAALPPTFKQGPSN